jgi:hypothetical protein
VISSEDFVMTKRLQGSVALVATICVAAGSVHAANSIIVSRDDNGGLVTAGYVGPSDPANYNDIPGEVQISGPEDGPYTVTFQSGVVSYDPADGDTLYRIFTFSSLDDHELIVNSVSVPTKDIAIWLDRPFTSDPAKFKKLDIDLTACRSSQVVASAIVGGLKQVKLNYNAAGPANAGRCELVVGTNVTAAVADISCYDYKLEVTGEILKDITCNGDLVGFIKNTGDAESTGSLIIDGNVTGSIELTVMEGNITADNFASTSTVTLDEMYGDITADDGAGAGEIAGTIQCTGDWSEFDGKATQDLLGTVTLGVAAGTVQAVGDLTGQININDMDGNLAGANLSPTTCIDPQLAAGSAIVWNTHAKINGTLVTDTTPIDGIQDECQTVPLLPGDTDGDGVLDDGDASGVAGDRPCQTGQDTGCDDNSRFVANGPLLGPAGALIQANSDCIEEHQGDAGDTCRDVCNKSQACDGDNDRTGDACDFHDNAYDTLLDFDNDGDVDGLDFSQFAQCFNKAGNPPRTLGCTVQAAESADSDDDGDVDGVDFSKFAQCFNKAGNTPRTLGCPPAQQLAR